MADHRLTQHPEIQMFKTLALAIALFAATPVLAQTVDEVNARIDAILGPHEIYQTAIESIQKAVAERDIAAIAGYIPFGETIFVNGGEEIIADEADLAARFDELFNARVIDSVVNQKYGELLVKDDGIMFGRGELWINGICVDDTCEDVFVNITAINYENF
jgi:hypothetical protein